MITSSAVTTVGPWQRDKERKDHIPEAQAMELARRSYQIDMDAGFDLLHIDPTKDPYVVGKVIDIELVLSRTVELIRFCEDYRKKNNLKEFFYEVGTEETNGGLTDISAYEGFIIELNTRLNSEGLPQPLFIVGQTGTLTRLTKNVGHFNDTQSAELSAISSRYGVGLKEHNGDYLPDEILLKHPGLGITAMNVAPAYGTIETRAYLKLAEVEKDLAAKGFIKSASDLKTILTRECVLSHKWEKWMTDEHKNKSEEQIFGEPELLKEILELSGHYNYEKPAVVKEMQTMFANLKSFGVEPERYVVNKIKDMIQNEAECFNMPGLTTRVAQAK